MIRAVTDKTCEGCGCVKDEPWAGTRSVAHRCWALGPQRGRTVGFDEAWNNLIPAWCPKRGGSLQDPPVYQNKDIRKTAGGVHETPTAEVKKMAARKYRDIRSALAAELEERNGPSVG